jgi:aspartyl-tRNA(Asn)/glutamyl-tRNA(Gln) amidotransferase subunit A
MLSVVAGFDPHDPASVNIPVDDYTIHIEEGIKDWRVALAVGNYIEASDPEVLASLNDVSQLFQDLGARLEKVDLSWMLDQAKANGQMTQADGAAFHRERLQQHPDWFGADILQRLQNGAALPSGEYILARRMQAEARRRFEMFFEKFDILLLPTTPIPAPSILGLGALEAAASLTRFTSPFNLTGLPALTLPCGFTKTGLPIGLQIVSKHWAEAKVLQAGYAFEQATEWHDRHPDI